MINFCYDRKKLGSPIVGVTLTVANILNALFLFKFDHEVGQI